MEYNSKDLIIERLKELLGSDYMNQYLPKDEMISIVANQIETIRHNEKEYLYLKKAIEELNNIKLIPGDIHSMFKTYEKVKEVSIKLRKIFFSAGLNLDIYNSIDYSLYYEGRRYSTETLKESWLEVSEDGKTLKINMRSAVDDISKEMKEQVDVEVNRLIQDHFLKYFTALTNMSGLHSSGMSTKGFNRGHAAEAYEEHFQEHHANLLKALKSSEYTSKDSFAVQEFREVAEKDVAKWYAHEIEGPNTMWQHLRHALGNQAGTVAGDVRGTQVKAIINYSGKYKDFKSLSLSNLTTLQNGIDNYSIIFSNKSAIEVARELVPYMTESIVHLEGRQNLINTMGEDVYIKTGLKEADELILKLKDMKIELVKM